VIVVNDHDKAITQSEAIRAMDFAKDARNVGPLLYLEELLEDEQKTAMHSAIADIEDE
jgi:hypothetical protein